MTLATATTVVRAVRQHGGGLVHTQQPRAHSRGRQLTSRGGVINRRCEATSIIPLPFPSSAAAVYPLTGVRRARILSPSLRSNNRPHAQLVVGYGHQISRSRLTPQALSPKSRMVAVKSAQFLSRGLNLIRPLFELHFCENSNHLGVNCMNPKRGIDLHQVRLSGEKQTPPLRCSFLFDQQRESSLKSSSPCSEVFLVMPTVPLATIACNQLAEKLINFHARLVAHQSIFISRALCLFSLLSHRLMPLPGRNADSNAYTYERPDCLNPSRPIDSVFRPGSINQPKANEECSNDDHRHRPSSLEPSERLDPNLHFQHGQLSKIDTALSLPAPCHHVQGDAA